MGRTNSQTITEGEKIRDVCSAKATHKDWEENRGTLMGSCQGTTFKYSNIFFHHATPAERFLGSPLRIHHIQRFTALSCTSRGGLLKSPNEVGRLLKIHRRGWRQHWRFSPHRSESCGVSVFTWKLFADPALTGQALLWFCLICCLWQLQAREFVLSPIWIVKFNTT